jgi:hypothetical protein
MTRILERWVRVARDPDAARAFIAAYVLGGVGAPGMSEPTPEQETPAPGT